VTYGLIGDYNDCVLLDLNIVCVAGIIVLWALLCYRYYFVTGIIVLKALLGYRYY
jgi:hypothetical protein